MPKNFLEKICKRELKSSAVLFSTISRNKSVNDVEYNDSIFKKLKSPREHVRRAVRKCHKVQYTVCLITMEENSFLVKVQIFKKAQSTQKSYHAVLYLNECI